MDTKAQAGSPGIRWWVWLLCLGALLFAIYPGEAVGLAALVLLWWGWPLAFIAVVVLVVRAIWRRGK